MTIKKITGEVSNTECLKKTYKMVPPEGGWGYMICIGCILVFVPSFAYKSCIGMIFNGFLEDLDEGISGFSVVSGLLSTMINLSGIVTNILLKNFSLRKVGWFGAFLYIVGIFGNCFITSVNQMIVTVGILQGLGSGICISIGFTSFNLYFVKKRLMVLSTTKILFALGLMVYPMFIKILMQEYGFRGTNLIATAIDLHLFLGIALLHPLKWHLIKEETTVAIVERDVQYVNHKIGNENEVDNKETSVRQESESLLSPNNTLNDGNNSQKIEHNENCIEQQNEDGHRYKNSLSISHTNDVQKMPLKTVTTDKKNLIWNVIVKYLDLDLLKDYVFINLACGMSISMNSEGIFYMLLPLYLFFINMTMGEVAVCLSAVSVGDFVSRIVVAILSSIFEFKSRTLFFCGVVGSTFFKLIFIYVYSFNGIVILCGLMGFFKGCMHIPLSLVYVEYNSERYTGAYGLGHAISGLFSAVITPLFGILKDVTGNYTVAFYVNTAISFFCIIPWMLEFCSNDFYNF